MGLKNTPQNSWGGWGQLKAGAKILPIAVGTVFALALIAALGAVGVTLLTPSGEQSKLVYEGDLWCVSNYIEEEPQEIMPDGRPRKDRRLDSRMDWIRREQVSASSKEEAEEKARQRGHGLFEPSDKEELRAALDRDDKDFFTRHFNTGATSPGPCWGSGEAGVAAGRWLSEAINDHCGFQPAEKWEIIKTLEATITKYSPCISGNTCDCPHGGGAGTSTGGTFKTVDGRLRWVRGAKVEDYVFAQPQSYHIIPRNLLDSQAVVLPGFNDNKPIHIRDVYGAGWHLNQNYLDLFLPCSEYGEFPANRKHTVQIVDLTKPIASSPTEVKTLPDGTPCPTDAAPGTPGDGDDYREQIAREFQRQLASIPGAGRDSEFRDDDEGTSPSPYTGPFGEDLELGKTAHPGGSNPSISFNSCHGSSLCHPGERSGHGAYQNRGRGDAVDITPADGLARAVFDGTARAGGSGRHAYTVVTSNNGRVRAYYYHTRNIKVGAVSAGDAIARTGAVGIRHIHFELLVDSKSVNGDVSLRGNERAYVRSLWDNMKKVLGL